MTEEQHKWLLLTVRELDRVVPNPEAEVQVTSDEDTVTFTATQDGYLRLGVEMLKAATVTSGEKDEDGVLNLDFSLSRLMAPDNEFEPHIYQMVETMPPPAIEEPYPIPKVAPWRERLESFLGFSFVLFLVVAMCVGIVTIITFLGDRLR